MRGFLLGIETLACAALLLSLSATWAAGMLYMRQAQEGMAVSESGALKLNSEVQGIVGSMPSYAALAQYSAMLNSTLPYGYRILAYAWPRGGAPPPAPGVDVRLVVIQGRIYYLEVYENENSG